MNSSQPSSTSGPQEYPLDSYPEYVTGLIIQTARPYVFSPIGMIADIICLIILQKKSTCSASLTPYLVTIAVCDAVCLLADLVEIPIGKMVVKSHSFCTTTYFISYVSNLTSDVMVAAMAVDRALVIAFPHKGHVFSTSKKTRCVIFATVMFEMLISAECFFTYTVDTSGQVCVRTGGTKVRQAAVLLILVHNLITWVIIVTCCCLIVDKLRARRRIREQLQMATPETSKDQQIGDMLLAIGALYIITNLPIICLHLTVHLSSWYLLSNYNLAVFTLLYESALVCKSINHCVKLALYCISAPVFRKELYKLFKPCIPERFRPHPPDTPVFGPLSYHMAMRITNATVFW